MTPSNHKVQGWRRRLPLILAVALAAAVLLIAVGLLAVDYLVDIWWFDALGYGFYYWQRSLYRYLVFVTVTLLFFLVFFLNFRIAARFMPMRPAVTGSESLSRPRRLMRQFQSGSAWVYAPLSLALSIPIALPLFARWEAFLFYIFGPGTGTGDPYFGKDIGFYLFSYPIYELIQRRLLLALVVVFAGLLVLYLLKNRLRQQPVLTFGRGAKWHLSLLFLALVAMEIWDLMLQRYALVFDASHQDLFFGPGYVQMRVVLPLIWACIVSVAGAGAALLAVFLLRKGLIVAVALILVFFGMLGLRHTDFLPGLVQAYIVQPNEIQKESPYIDKHIQATLNAYQLKDLEIRQFGQEDSPADSTISLVEDLLRNIPVWDAEALEDVFHQLQELRSYYMFPLVSVGRYQIGDRRQQVYLSPREIEFDNLPGSARNWINEHMVYTHGFGVVMTPASQVSTDAMTWYLYNIPPESRHGLTIAQPRIYFGAGRYTYSIVPNRAGEMDYPRGDTNVTTAYSGRGGVPISSLLRKLLFAYYLKNKNVFFSTRITEESRLLFRRNIVERIRHLVPYLVLDQTPYVAVTDEGIYWIVDAYTTSDTYPAAAPQRLGDLSFNYIRNSVKIVVDAYHGSVDLYIYDESDPVIRAYDRIYPGLFQSRDRLPAALKPHVRYPKDLFNTQMQVYAKYHQQDTYVFYQQEDLWTFAADLSEQGLVPHQPYYVTLDLIERGQMDFSLLLPLFPKNRDNLRVLALAGCDPDNYGRLIIYNFPKGELVYGPAQIDALINQDPEIARQFTLWNQVGSEVERGRMIILPVGDSILFIQAVYLKATTRVKIPELQRIIMSQGRIVVMEPTVEAAYAELMQQVAGDGPPTEPDRPAPSLDKPPEPAPETPQDLPPEPAPSAPAPTPPEAEDTTI